MCNLTSLQRFKFQSLFFLTLQFNCIAFIAFSFEIHKILSTVERKIAF